MCDIETRNVSDLPDMTYGRVWHSACTFNKRYIYVLGGFENKSRYSLTLMERLDLRDPK